MYFKPFYTAVQKERQTHLPNPGDSFTFFSYGSQEIFFWQFFSAEYQNIKCIWNDMQQASFIYCLYFSTDELPASLIYIFPKQNLPSLNLMEMVAWKYDCNEAKP